MGILNRLVLAALRLKNPVEAKLAAAVAELGHLIERDTYRLSELELDQLLSYGDYLIEVSKFEGARIAQPTIAEERTACLARHAVRDLIPDTFFLQILLKEDMPLAVPLGRKSVQL
ncbi:Uncharacterised protein [Halioglobus japonicus]|nr:Uncharacterised protein [Halioglobus japonicus]